MNLVQVICLILAIAFFLYSLIRFLIAFKEWRAKRKARKAEAAQQSEDKEKGEAE